MPFPYLARGLRRLSVARRPLPRILGIGAMRSGTTSLFAALRQHPEVALPQRKEVHFFDLHFHRGENWYRAFYPLGDRVGLDFTPSYMTHPLAPGRAAGLIPDARLVVLLRDPVERFWSHFRYRQMMGTELRSFAEVLDDELSKPAPAVEEYAAATEIPYLTGGLYAPQLRRWYEVFDAEQILVLDSAELFEDPQKVLSRLLDFLELTPFQIPYHRLNSSPPQAPPASIARIEDFYASSNRDLVELTAASFSWVS